ncbi:hypothetical protein [Streptomyces ochraceiscleroticus]|nr:hypothetical protein [Streptomyces ochraceiscleroticus]
MSEVLCAVLAKAGLAIAEAILTRFVIDLYTAYVRKHRTEAAMATA